MDRYCKPKEAAKHFGVALSTLRQWDKEGIIKCIRTKSNGTGQRRFDISSYRNGDVGILSKREEEPSKEVLQGKRRVCYCRVSSRKQKDDLERQKASLQSLYPTHTIVTDIASGLNFKRPGLLSLLEEACRGVIEEVVVAHKDRLARFGVELIEWIFRSNGVKLTILQEDHLSADPELCEDMLNIVNVLASRANGKRKYKKKERPIQTEEEDQKSDSEHLD
jgi:putative resolvase